MLEDRLNFIPRGSGSTVFDPTKRYLHEFGTISEFDTAYSGEDYHEPWASGVHENSGVAYNKKIVTSITFENLVWVTDIPASGGTATKDNCRNYNKYYYRTCPSCKLEFFH